jgi:hypothetical protein
MAAEDIRERDIEVEFHTKPELITDVLPPNPVIH